MTTIRIGIAGCGQIALGVHLPILLSTPHVKITALADTDQVKLRAAASSAPLIGPLVGGALALVMLSIGSAIVTAAGKPHWVLPVALPLLLIAISAHLIAIPRWGSVGEATVTLATALLGATGAMVQVYRLWCIYPSGATVLRSMAICVLAWTICAKWNLPLPFLPVKLVLVTLIIVTAFFVTGEFRIDDINTRSRFRNQGAGVFEGASVNPT
jgi:hypothetical protein